MADDLYDRLSTLVVEMIEKNLIRDRDYVIRCSTLLEQLDKNVDVPMAKKRKRVPKVVSVEDQCGFLTKSGTKCPKPAKYDGRCGIHKNSTSTNEVQQHSHGILGNDSGCDACEIQGNVGTLIANLHPWNESDFKAPAVDDLNDF